MSLDIHWAIEKLSDLCRIPSIRFPNFDHSQVDRSAHATAQVLREAGFPEVQVVQGSYAPAVIAAWGHDAKKPTVLLYAHHDVQPAMDPAKWQSPAFEPQVRNGRLYARGAADDKAGILVHAMAAAGLTDAERPNLRVVIEGEEEIGSPYLADLLRCHKEFLQSDAAIIADLGNYDTGIPALTTSLRGMVALEVEVHSLEHSVHSGMWSGPVPDPVQALCKMIASLTDAQGQIAVPGVMEQVIPPDVATRSAYQKLEMDAEKFRKDAHLLGSALLCKEEDLAETLWRKPSITVTTFEAGNRKATGNVLLASAYARISVRLVPGMDWNSIVDLFSRYLREQCPWGLQVKITPDDGANAWTTSVAHPYFQTMRDALTKGYGQETRIIGCGASIPGAPLFTDVFGDIPVLLTGLEDHKSNAHGENESLDLADFAKAIASEQEFLRQLTK